MTLGMGVVIGEELIVDRRLLMENRIPAINSQQSTNNFLPYGSVMNFCRMRSSGYFGKKASTVKTFPGVRSRVAIDSVYSICSPGLIRTLVGVSLIAWFSDHFVSTLSAELSSCTSIRWSVGNSRLIM